MAEPRSRVADGPIHERLEEAFDEVASRRVEARLLASMKRRRAAGRVRTWASPVRMGWAAAAVAVLGIGAAVVLMDDRTAAPDRNGAVAGEEGGAPLRVVGSDAVFSGATADARRRTVALSDGSTIELALDTSIRVRRNDDRRLELALSRGRADFEVEAGDARAWSIDAGLARVEVVGTRFTLERSAAAVSVVVQRGIVRVIASRLEEGSRLLESGQNLVIERKPLQDAARDAGAQVADGGGSSEPQLDDNAPGSSTRWRDFYRRGAYDRAYAELERAGIQVHTRRNRDPETLWAMADAARRSGHATEAVEPLRKLIRRAPRGHRAALAAFTLGRIRMEELDEPAQAASDFERAVQLGLPGALKRAARMRRVEALQAAGRREAATRAAREYLQRYPRDEHADRMRSLAGSGRTSE